MTNFSVRRELSPPQIQHPRLIILKMGPNNLARPLLIPSLRDGVPYERAVCALGAARGREDLPRAGERGESDIVPVGHAAGRQVAQYIRTVPWKGNDCLSSSVGCYDPLEAVISNDTDTDLSTAGLTYCMPLFSWLPVSIFVIKRSRYGEGTGLELTDD